MDWKSGINGFSSYLLLERSLSKNSVESYTRDIEKLALFSVEQLNITSPANLVTTDIELFLKDINKLGLSDRSQARLLSGIRAFFKFLLIENVIQIDPSHLIDSPKLSQKIPDFLSIDEMDLILGAIDLSHPQGQRNRAILETLYSCGLRVSELVHLKLSNYFPDIGFIRVIGKNDKERIVPIGSVAIKFINLYLDTIRRHQTIDKQSVDILFLNRRGKQLSRVMIFTIVKKAVSDAGIQKTVSPHTFRHSFATHLVEGGADLKSIQDMLGHESITTTEIYTHLDTKYLRDTILLYHPRNAGVK